MKLRIANCELRMQPELSPLAVAANSPFEIRRSQFERAFTLIELILIMALLVIAVSFVTSPLSNFFRGRAMDSEVRQFIALAHAGQSRAVSEGVPMLLWIDDKQGTYGLEVEPSYSDKDPKAEEFTLDKDLHFEIPNNDPTPAIAPPSLNAANNPHAGLPQIRFLPEGAMAESSPKTIRFVNTDGSVISLTKSRDRNQYEVTTNAELQN